jgi:hypothetical protein
MGLSEYNKEFMILRFCGSLFWNFILLLSSFIYVWMEGRRVSQILLFMGYCCLEVCDVRRGCSLIGWGSCDALWQHLGRRARCGHLYLKALQ